MYSLDYRIHGLSFTPDCQNLKQRSYGPCPKLTSFLENLALHVSEELASA